MPIPASRARRPSFQITGMVAPHERFNSGRGIVVATDAAVSRQLSRAAAGFVATSGLYGVSGHPQPPEVAGQSPVAVAELRSVWLAVKALNGSIYSDVPVTVWTDSTEALCYLRAWQAGKISQFPKNYRTQTQRASGRRSSLERLAGYLSDPDSSRFRFSKVHGHAGDILNEAADSLAKLGLRAGGNTGLPPGQITSVAERIVATRLRDYWQPA
jgi:ribonuclease HI